MAEIPFGYIVVEGPIGVGKTTLAARLAQSYGAQLLLEAPQENPFLARFYENPRAYALSTQLFFLLQRSRQTDSLAQRDMFAQGWVGDYMVQKDRIFAELSLDADELELYEQVHQRVMSKVPVPDLVIYLQAPVSVLRERIAKRGIGYELAMDTDYLQRLVAAYTSFFHDYEDSPLVIVNASEIDLVGNDADYHLLFEKIQQITNGRHYLNPLPF